MDKYRTLEQLAAIVQEQKRMGRTVVLGNGTFDLLHVGHVRYLEGAKAEGDVLIVAINDDESVRSLKGPGRPLLPLEHRLEMVGSLRCVDYVTSFPETDASKVIATLKPDVHAKGTDYTKETVPEVEAVRAIGGRVAITGDPKNHSVRDIIARIAALNEE